MGLKYLTRIPADITHQHKDQIEELAVSRELSRAVIVRKLLTYILSNNKLIDAALKDTK